MLLLTQARISFASLRPISRATTQRSAAWSGRTLVAPGLQDNACSNPRKLDRGPITRNFGMACESSLTICRMRRPRFLEREVCELDAGLIADLLVEHQLALMVDARLDRTALILVHDALSALLEFFVVHVGLHNLAYGPSRQRPRQSRRRFPFAEMRSSEHRTSAPSARASRTT